MRKAIRTAPSASWCRSPPAARSIRSGGSWRPRCRTISASRSSSKIAPARAATSAPTPSRNRRPTATRCCCTTSGHAITPALYRTVPYDAVKDFTPVSQVLATTFVLVASPKLPVTSIADVVALAKSKPGGLNYGSSGVGAPLHLAMEVFKHSAGIDVQHIPYRGDAPVNAALIGGEIELAVVPQSTGLPFIKSGSIRPLRRDRHETLAGAARGADHRRGRRRRPRNPKLERPVRAGEHAPRDRHDDPEGRRRLDGFRRGSRPHPRDGPGPDRQHAGGVRRACSSPILCDLPR